MLADVRLVVSAKEVRLTFRRDGEDVEDEIWKFERRLAKEEAAVLSTTAFAATYDLIQHIVHGDE
ncbi:MAG: hypothetical protein EBR82_38630 [Caulobacteraceae bacterium]|nr:hypothetical protein [Caulobacteraceae bacterium]NDD03887.1 hypothetical protein [Pseudomonadota bacterium]NDG19273.1 hypothetical protein [Betaproteobacteria bacterium]